MLKELIELALIASMAFLQLVEHRDIELIAEVDEDGGEYERFEVHEATLERCFFFLVEFGRLLRLFRHFFISFLLSQVCKLLALELGPAFWTTSPCSQYQLLVPEKYRTPHIVAEQKSS